VTIQRAVQMIRELREALVWDDAVSRALLGDVSTPNLGSDMRDVADCLNDILERQSEARERVSEQRWISAEEALRQKAAALKGAQEREWAR